MLRDQNLLNTRLLSYLSSAGHTDVVMIADAGLPIPSGVPVVDLSLVPGLPSFEATLRVVLSALVVESAVVANEARAHRSGALIERLLGDVKSEWLDHEELKRLARTAHVVVRTGECTPYANVALVAGVSF